jgi:transcription initiation factor TFIIIB Brf1 subunit/transcription initiation factor TFIIB
MDSLFPGRVHHKPVPEFAWKWEDRGQEGVDTEDEFTQSTKSVCPCATSDDTIIHEDLNVCTLCGDVKNRSIESGAEYRFFGHDDRSSNDPCRVGAPTDFRFPSSSLGTIILTKSSGGPSTARAAMARIRRYHTWNMLPYRERALLQVYEMLALAATNHGLDQSVIDNAKDLYVQLVEHCDKRGLSRTSVIASCMYASLKKVGQPRKPKEVADMFHLTTGQFTKSFKYFQEVLAIAQQRGLIQQTSTPSNLESTRARDYIHYPLSQLGIPRTKFEEISVMATTLCDYIEDNELSPENMPPSLGAGVIGFLLQRRGLTEVSYERIATVCGVSEGTLQKCLRRLETHKKRLETLIPKSV